MRCRGVCKQQQAATPGREPAAARPPGRRWVPSTLRSQPGPVIAAGQRPAAGQRRRAVAAAAAAEVSDAAPAPSAPAPSPANQQLRQPVPWQEAGQGVTFYAGSSTFRVWAPHASAVVLQVVPAAQFVAAPAPAPPSAGGDSSEAPAPAAAVQGDDLAQPGMVEHPLERHYDDFGVSLPSGALAHGCAYRLVVTGAGGARLLRRDPWARSADPASSWSFAHSPAAYTWQNTGWQPLSYDRVRLHGGGGVCMCWLQLGVVVTAVVAPWAHRLLCLAVAPRSLPLTCPPHPAPTCPPPPCPSPALPCPARSAASEHHLRNACGVVHTRGARMHWTVTKAAICDPCKPACFASRLLTRAAASPACPAAKPGHAARRDRAPAARGCLRIHHAGADAVPGAQRPLGLQPPLPALPAPPAGHT